MFSCIALLFFFFNVMTVVSKVNLCTFHSFVCLFFVSFVSFRGTRKVGMSGACYPDRLINSIPNIYYYAANNPSEATIAKRRSYATTISYLTPPAENAGLYKV